MDSTDETDGEEDDEVREGGEKVDQASDEQETEVAGGTFACKYCESTFADEEKLGRHGVEKHSKLM